MPSLSLFPPRQESNPQSSSPPAPPQLSPPAPAGIDTAPSPAQAPASPVAPAYSPITPRAQPVFPAPATSPHFTPEPAPQPFSGEDATDAIALRAAISSLQFQKKKAQDDIRTLEKTRKQALDDPALFKSELAAGRLNEEKPKIGNLQAILDEAESDDDEDEVVLGAANPEDAEDGKTPSSSSSNSKKDEKAPFGRIPGPQNVVRMPHVNWDKYHITGEPLDSMHEQQRKWPGSSAYGQNRGREHAVAAPYSPWQDPLDGQQKSGGHKRNDSIANPVTAMTPGTISEHPMETRRRTHH